MTDNAADAMNTDEEADPPDEVESTDSDDEIPDVDDEEMADLGAVHEEIEDLAQESDESDAEETNDDQTDGSTDGSTDDVEGSETSTTSVESNSPDWGGKSVGDLYVDLAAKTTNSVIRGLDEDADPDVSADEFRAVDVDKSVNAVMQKRGRPEDVPPEQWVAIATLGIVVGEVVAQTDILEEAINDAI